MNADNDEYKNGARVIHHSRPIAYGGTYRIRTCDLWFRRPVLYPTELMPQSSHIQLGNGPLPSSFTEEYRSLWG